MNADQADAMCDHEIDKRRDHEMEEQRTAPFCRDCAHSRANPNAPDDPEMTLCDRKTRTSLVSGITRTSYCDAERNFGECGATGKYFERIADIEAELEHPRRDYAAAAE